MKTNQRRQIVESTITTLSNQKVTVIVRKVPAANQANTVANQERAAA